jgi:hypothetical protein
LVRKLELACRVVETGVHHYPRLHGRSQFFRLRSLAVTFSQLTHLWVRLVVLRQTKAAPRAKEDPAESALAWPSSK